jgi:hypothetical protein
MTVRVKVRIQTEREVEETVAALNSYYETKEPEILLPLALASRLGISPREGEPGIYQSPAGPAVIFRSPSRVKVEVLVPDRKTRSVSCLASVSEIWDEVALSDKLIEELGIVPEKPGSGLWRFLDERKLRKSEKPQFWR